MSLNAQNKMPNHKTPIVTKRPITVNGKSSNPPFYKLNKIFTNL